MNEDLNHPLRVVYPYGGKHFLLHYHTDSDQGHVILAKSTPSINKVFKSIIENTDEDIKIFSFYEIDIVAPSEELCDLAVKEQHLQDVEDFKNEIGFSLLEAIKRGKELPLNFKKCTNFISSRGYLDSSIEEDHYDCVNCGGVITHSFLAPKEFYDKYAKSWYLLNPKRINIAKEWVYSKAGSSSDNNNIWIANPDFGHHQSGINLIRCQFSQPMRPALFFFKILEDLNFYDLKILCEENKKMREFDNQKKISAEKTRRDNEREFKILQLINFFTGFVT